MDSPYRSLDAFLTTGSGCTRKETRSISRTQTCETRASRPRRNRRGAGSTQTGPTSTVTSKEGPTGQSIASPIAAPVLRGCGRLVISIGTYMIPMVVAAAYVDHRGGRFFGPVRSLCTFSSCHLILVFLNANDGSRKPQAAFLHESQSNWTTRRGSLIYPPSRC